MLAAVRLRGLRALPVWLAGAFLIYRSCRGAKGYLSIWSQGATGSGSDHNPTRRARASFSSKA